MGCTDYTPLSRAKEDELYRKRLDREEARRQAIEAAKPEVIELIRKHPGEITLATIQAWFLPEGFAEMMTKASLMQDAARELVLNDEVDCDGQWKMTVRESV